MSWEKDIKELKKREKLAEKMGGKEKLQRQKNNKRLNVRERIDLLLDKNSFHEIGKIAGKAEYDKEGNLQKFTPSNFVMGRGDINGRKIVVGADDFTVRGGAADAAGGAPTQHSGLHVAHRRVRQGARGGPRAARDGLHD